jgi:HAD domain in Swiss Army Knife RNA repair proteins
MRDKEPARPIEEPSNAPSGGHRPLLMVDIDGVLSLFGVPHRDSPTGRPVVEGTLHSIDGTPHFLSSTAAAHLLSLAQLFDLVWASGWEERANEHLPHLLGVPTGLPHLRFPRMTGSPPARANAHWKLDAIDAYAVGRPLAWIDDALNPACHAWARARTAPTLLVQTEPQQGLTQREAELLAGWARALRASRAKISSLGSGVSQGYTPPPTPN